MTITLKDVAKHAGVSPATASLILNNKAGNVRISEATRERVLQSAQMLNYSPNRTAQSLRTSRSYAIGIISFDTNDPIANAYTSALDRLLVGRGYRTIVSDACHNAARAIEHLQYFASSRIDGIIFLSSSYIPEKEPIQTICLENGLIAISVLRDLTPLGLQSFVVDYRTGTRNATCHLLDQGFHQIAVIVGSNTYRPDNIDRLEGILEACEERNIVIDPRYIVQEDEGGWNPSVGYRSMKKLLSLDPLPDAVAAFDDVTAFGAIRAIYNEGKWVPGDIAVMGFDDVMVSEFYNPPLTTVKHPINTLTKAAAEYMLHAIESGESQDPECSTFTPELIIRKSTLHTREQSHGIVK